MHRRPPSSRFTLIELLVVVAIIMVLAAILLPSLAYARALSQRVACGSNLKQLGLGMLSYTGDYDDRLAGNTSPGGDTSTPLADNRYYLVNEQRWVDDANHFWSWDDCVDTYIGTKLTDAEKDINALTTSKYYLPILSCPVQRPIDTGHANKVARNYGTSNGITFGQTNTYYRPLNQVKYPERTLLMTECWGGYRGGVNDSSNTGTAQIQCPFWQCTPYYRSKFNNGNNTLSVPPGRTAAATWHPMSLNYLMCDGSLQVAYPLDTWPLQSGGTWSTTSNTNYQAPTLTGNLANNNIGSLKSSGGIWGTSGTN